MPGDVPRTPTKPREGSADTPGAAALSCSLLRAPLRAVLAQFDADNIRLRGRAPSAKDKADHILQIRLG